jgi:hypothetical protein
MEQSISNSAASTRNTSPKQATHDSNGEKSTLHRNGKTPLLLIGTSNIKFIEPQRWLQYATQKVTAYTIESAVDKVNNCDSDQKPAVTIFHSLTNDIKSPLDADGCVKKMASLVDKTLDKFPDTKIIISLATPRSDNDDWNAKGELINAMIKHNYRKAENIHLCDNSNLAELGRPIPRLLEEDGIHLSAEGTAVLAANLKRLLDNICNIHRRRQDQTSNQRPKRKGYRNDRTNQFGRKYGRHSGGDHRSHYGDDYLLVDSPYERRHSGNYAYERRDSRDYQRAGHTWR